VNSHDEYGVRNFYRLPVKCFVVVVVTVVSVCVKTDNRLLYRLYCENRHIDEFKLI